MGSFVRLALFLTLGFVLSAEGRVMVPIQVSVALGEEGAPHDATFMFRNNLGTSVPTVISGLVSSSPLISVADKYYSRLALLANRGHLIIKTSTDELGAITSLLFVVEHVQRGVVKAPQVAKIYAGISIDGVTRVTDLATIAMRAEEGTPIWFLQTNESCQAATLLAVRQKSSDFRVLVKN